MLEMLLVVLIMTIVAALALPSALTALQNYRLHADAGELASYLNVVRMRAASQYSPYRLDIYVNTGQYTVEKLCGDTSSASPVTTSANGQILSDPNCISPYASYTTPQYEFGTQYIATSDYFSSCVPSGTSAAFPGTGIAGATCPGANPMQVCFNTRGMPVDCGVISGGVIVSGNPGGPLASNGVAIYLSNQKGMVDSVTLSVGGAVGVWNWDAAAGAWAKR